MGRKVNFGLWYDLRNPAPWAVPFETLYRQCLDQIAEAERLGFDSVWLTEHHFCDDGYTPSPAGGRRRDRRAHAAHAHRHEPDRAAAAQPGAHRRGRGDAVAAHRWPVRSRRRHRLPRARVPRVRTAAQPSQEPDGGGGGDHPACVGRRVHRLRRQAVQLRRRAGAPRTRASPEALPGRDGGGSDRPRGADRRRIPVDRWHRPGCLRELPGQARPRARRGGDHRRSLGDHLGRP